MIQQWYYHNLNRHDTWDKPNLNATIENIVDDRFEAIYFAARRCSSGLSQYGDGSMQVVCTCHSAEWTTTNTHLSSTIFSIVALRLGLSHASCLFSLWLYHCWIIEVWLLKNCSLWLSALTRKFILGYCNDIYHTICDLAWIRQDQI